MPPTNGIAPIWSFLGSLLMSTRLIFLAILEATNNIMTKPVALKRYDCKDISGPSARATNSTRKYSANIKKPKTFNKISILQ